MYVLRRSFRAICFAAAVALVWFATAEAWAADAPAPAAGSEKSYVKSYALVLLGIVLGVLIVCRSATRTTEIKYEDDD